MISRQHRFHGLHAVDGVYKRAITVRGEYLSLKYTPNLRGATWRAAVVVSKKVSKSAVTRNRIRRRIYEAIRQQSPSISQPYDLVCMVYRAELATMSSADLQREVIQLLLKAKIITSVIG